MSSVCKNGETFSRKYSFFKKKTKLEKKGEIGISPQNSNPLRFGVQNPFIHWKYMARSTTGDVPKPGLSSCYIK
jgi:hypothetical protein